MAQKRPFGQGRQSFKPNKKQKKVAATGDGSHDEVLLKDIRQLLQATRLSGAEPDPAPQEVDNSHIENGEVELEITEVSSTGDGLAHKNGHVHVVPFTAPGDTVVAKIYRSVRAAAGEDSEAEPALSYAVTDLVKVVKPSPLRTEEPKCPYFAQCSGCQFQHLSYAWQLEHKRRIVEKAYANFSALPAAAVPAVGETIASPLQYGYRTKLTPHFDGPPGGRRDRRNGKQAVWPGVPPIGFMLKGTRKTLDIEDCPIGTQAVRNGMKSERQRVSEDIDKYQKGATLLLRESTERMAKTDEPGDNSNGARDDSSAVREDRGDHIHLKTCITDSNAVSTEYVDDFRFDNPAGSFFQNNNSILPVVVEYIRDNILGAPVPPTEAGETKSSPGPKITNLIDAYCGSGFFTVVLSPLFTRSIGIDIAAQSIASASTNARLNNLTDKSTRFIAADANDLFASLKPDAFAPPADGDAPHFAPDETVVVIDPPRKGCDAGFIRQLLAFAPARICYVSCNVHTQARDVGMMVAAGPEGGDGPYEVESLRGFDFFPQTGHVEGVAMLRRRR